VSAFSSLGKLRQVRVTSLIVAVFVIAAIVSPWAISIPPAHASESFGFQTPACWLAVVALFAAVLVADLRIGVLAVIAGEGVLVAWFGWAMWVVTTPRFAQLPFPFVGTDLMGSGWYFAGMGLLVAAGDVVKRLIDSDAPIRTELWLLTALPGFGLMRLGRWVRGLIWTFLFSTAVYLASFDSPDSGQFAEYGRSNNVPPAPPTRSPEWFLLGLAIFFWTLSVIDSIRENRRRRLPEPEPFPARSR
jgi:hypothetical protein